MVPDGVKRSGKTLTPVLDATTARRYATSLPQAHHRPPPAPAHATPAPAQSFRFGTGGRDFDRGATIAVAAGLEAERQEPREDREENGVISTTIHKAKGGEAVALPNPKALKRLFAAWHYDNTDTSDTRRIYYVAATRARRFLGSTYLYSTHGEMAEHFRSLDIEFTIAPECEASAPERRQRRKRSRGPAGMEAIPGLGWGE